MKHAEIMEQQVAEYLAAKSRFDQVVGKLHKQVVQFQKEITVNPEDFSGSFQLYNMLDHKQELISLVSDNDKHIVAYRFWAQDDKINNGQSFEVALIEIRYVWNHGDKTHYGHKNFYPLPVSRRLTLQYLHVDPLHNYNHFGAYLKDDMFRAILKSFQSDAIEPGADDPDSWEIKKTTQGIF